MSEARTTHRAFYDRIASYYDLMADSSEHKAREAGESALGLREGERVLEIGFGTGNGLVEMARAVGPTGKLTGLDVSEGMLAVAREKVQREGQSSIVELELGDARDLPFDDESFDAAFLSFTLELFEEEDIPKVLRAIRRVLRPGGRLGVVSMAVADGHPSLLERGYVWMHRHFPHIVDCRPIEPRRGLEAAGFTMLHEETLSIWTMPVAIVVAVKPPAHSGDQGD